MGPAHAIRKRRAEPGAALRRAQHGRCLVGLALVGAPARLPVVVAVAPLSPLDGGLGAAGNAAQPATEMVHPRGLQLSLDVVAELPVRSPGTVLGAQALDEGKSPPCAARNTAHLVRDDLDRCGRGRLVLRSSNSVRLAFLHLFACGGQIVVFRGTASLP